ncbi:Protein EMSY-LIKE 4 [Zea mays]|nr:Protein EMSY-LIKE 4 [Zea mays]
MGPEDIRWQEDDSGIDPVTYLRSRGGPTSGVRKPAGRGGPMPGSVRGRGLQKNMPKKDFPPPQNGVGKRSSDDIDILHTESLIKEVGKVFSVSNPDPQEVEKAKKALKEQEQSLIDAIARLAEASDGESDGHNRGRRNLYAANQHQASYVGAMPVGDRAGAM